MKFCSLSRTLLAGAGVAGVSLGLTSCANDHTVGYAYVLGTSANGQPSGQIGIFREDNNNGTLSPVAGSPLGSGGLNPVRAVIPAGNRFFYALNAGQAQTDGTAGDPLAGAVTGYSSNNLALFTVGGYGQLSPQLQYTSQGFGSIRVLADSSGAHLFVLDKYANVGVTSNTAAPISQVGPSADYPCQDSANPAIYHPTGAITVFAIDGSTGRLGVQQNQRQQNLTYFPVGCNPVDFRLAGGFLYTMDAGAPVVPNIHADDRQTVNVYAVAGTGQLTPTQTSQIQITSDPTTTNITAITGDSGGRYVYLLDTTNNRIFLYTVGTSGALTAVSGSPYNNANNSQAGGPVQTLTDSTGKYVYVINAGPAGGTTNASSDLGGFSVNSTSGYFDTLTANSPYAGTISGPVCIFEDPTNQYIYSAGSLDNSITGRRIDPATGTLVPLRNHATVPTVGTPSWCLGISSAL